MVTLAGGGGCMLDAGHLVCVLVECSLQERRGLQRLRNAAMLLDMQSYSASSLVSISFQCNRCGTWAVGTQQSTLVVFFLRGHVFIMMNLKQ